MTWLLIVMLAAVGAGAAAAMRWPFAGLLTYLWLDFMRLSDLFVELRSVRPMLVIGGATVAGTLWQERARLLDGWRALLPVAAVAAVAAASLLVSVDRGLSLRALIEIGKMVVLVWLMQRLLDREARVRAVMIVLVVSLLVLAVQAIQHAEALGSFTTALANPFIRGPAGLDDGAFRDNNDLGRVLVLAVPLCWALAASPGSRWLRGAAALALVVTIAGIEATFSRTGFLTLLLATAAVATFYRPLRRGAAAWLVFVAVLVVVSPRPYLARVCTLGSPATDDSVQGHVAIWREALALVLRRPALGQGVGTFRSGENGEPMVRRPSHNILLEVAVELGAAGLTAYAWMILDALWRLWRVRVAPSSAFASVAAVAITAALLAYLMAGISLSQAFASPLFVLLGLALGLARGWRLAGPLDTRGVPTADPVLP